jgi:putative addiction module antidote
MASVMTQIGNSVGVIIPTDIRKKANLKKGNKINFEVAPDGKVIMSRVGAKSSKSSITPEFLEIVKRVNQRYAKAFKELAGK